MSKRHEQLLFRYSSALERGDFEAVAEVLHDAEHDPALEQMILDMNAAYNAEASVNHKNPKEVPMIAALYQKQIRPPARLEWQSLPLVAALAVIGLLVVLLAVQTRGANFSNTGDNGQGTTPLVYAQNNTRCQATLLTDATLLSLPGPGGIDLYSLPAGASVYVRASYGSPVWYLINSQASQGWVTSDKLDMSHCAGSQILPSLPTATPGVSSQTSPTPDQFDLTWTCGARVQTEIDLAAFPSLNTVYIGSLPAETAVTVLDYNIMVGSQGIQTPWYLIKSGSIQGWTPAYLLDAPNCPAIPDMNLGVVSPYIQAQTATAQAALLATATQMIRNATRSAVPPTFTSTPAPLNGGDSAAQNDTAQSALMTRVCKATTLIPADIRAFPTLSSVVKKSLPAQIIVTLGEYTITNDSQGHGQIWYFVESEGVQGWMMASLLDASVCPPILDAATVIPPPVVPLPNADTAGVAQHPFYIYTPPPPAVMTAIIATALATMNAPYQPMATPTLIPDDQQGGVPAVKCPTPSSVSRIMMYARPSLDSFKFSQVYDAARYAFFLLNSTEVDGQTWYFVRIGATVDEKQGWITWDDYNILKDCAPFNAVTQADAVPSDSTLPLVPTIVPASVQALPTFTPTPADIQAVATIAPSVSASVTDHFPIYTVQAGDTVLAILSQFGLDAEALPRLQALNFLSNAVNLRPGMALVIPASLPDSVTTCTILSGQSIEMRADPLKADPLVYFLPQPTSFVIEGEFQNGDGMWAAVSAQAGSITMAGVWIRVDQMDGAAACSQSDATLVIATPTLVR